MTGGYTSPLVLFASRVQAPLLQLYALYVLFHGHYSPGGGFQAGAALAGSYLFPRIAQGQAEGQRLFPVRRATDFALLGVFIYFGVGLLTLALGGAFLDYSALHRLPWPMPEGSTTRAIGSLVVEVGVALTVMGVMLSLFDDLVARVRPEE